MDINTTDILHLLANGGGTAILLYLLLREQQRSQRIEEQLIEVLQELADLRARVTQEFKAIQSGEQLPPGRK